MEQESRDGSSDDPQDRDAQRDVACEPESPAAQTRAEGFQAVRDAHRSEIAEDYVELIQELIERSGEARPVDIAERMGVRQPTVAKNLARLQRDGLIRRERYRSVFLTGAGQALADVCRERHKIVVEFLLGLGLDRETAEQDAEGIEHHVSDRTLAAFERAVKASERPG
ncbi:manganese-binding transcriptional regulator MntR [Roseitranquillus sediminis]|uniref:manganese-binding transcriptional regulator MntR n=1 Tax=Roseitranquillus sediminis TaxID=2809051 RepID=UPI001D0CD7C0|nr:manganese-binding transcriptional regulator MntR [Roseitranquillus sediminis]MBM9595134.1 manganese-binding transcriptional regulator MntR [Roseitranquillus sediminis]